MEKLAKVAEGLYILPNNVEAVGFINDNTMGNPFVEVSLKMIGSSEPITFFIDVNEETFMEDLNRLRKPKPSLRDRTISMDDRHMGDPR